MAKGSKEILKHIVNFVESEKCKNKVDIAASICLEKCSNGPNTKVAGKTVEHCTSETVEKAILDELKKD